MSNIKTTRVKRKYDRISCIYDLMEMLPERLLYRKWRIQALSHLYGRTLEVGVGTGRNMSYYPEGVRVIAIDLSEKMLAKAARKARKLGLDIRLAVMDAQNLAFKDGVFDSTLATFVFCSVPDPIIGLSELTRVCKPEGRMVFLEHVRSSNTFLAALMDLMNPIVLWLIGDNINRNTLENIKKVGARLVCSENLFINVFKFVVAENNRGDAEDYRVSV